MKDSTILALCVGILFGAMICVLTTGLRNHTTNNKQVIKYITKQDTIRDTIPKYIVYVDSSYIHKYDSLHEKLIVANFKLNRIAEYNRIASQKNNLKYLRGWINRTLK